MTKPRITIEQLRALEDAIDLAREFTAGADVDDPDNDYVFKTVELADSARDWLRKQILEIKRRESHARIRKIAKDIRAKYEGRSSVD